MRPKINQLQSRHQLALPVSLSVIFAIMLSLLSTIHAYPAAKVEPATPSTQALASASSTPEDPAAKVGPATPSTVDLQWYDITAKTVAAAKFPAPVTESRVWANSWLAAARAIGNRNNPNVATAAFATALHDTLIELVPSQKSQLDTELTSTLASIPDGVDKSQGISVGKRSATTVLTERSKDGLDSASVDIPFTPPPAAPGVWQPTPPKFGKAVRAGQGKAKPFLLRSNKQFRAPPPPSLTSKTYLDALAEVRAMGSATSNKTPEQKDISLFWQGQSIHIFVPVLRAALADAQGSLRQKARLVAAFHVISTDAQIAIYESKYEYVFWRPVTAIRNGTVNPDPNWESFFAAPSHPEYPSGHCGYAGAVAEVLKQLVGPQPLKPISITSTTAPDSTRTYKSWSQFTEENNNARVWEGVHFRFSDEIATQIGQKVASYELPRLGSIGL